MDYKDALRFLEEKISYENLADIYYSSDNFDLGKLEFALEKLGVDYNSLKYIHIAGSKGKGTTANLLARYLIEDGFKVGLYTSPHLFDLRERVVLNGRKITKTSFAANFVEIEKCMRTNGISLSYFEFLTILAIKFFVDQKVDFAVLETGIGGRLDATNVVKPVVSVLTRVEKEHLQLLGGSIESIVYEKMGVIKPSVPFVVGLQNKDVWGLINENLLKCYETCDSFFVKNFESEFEGFFQRIEGSNAAFLENVKLAFVVILVLMKKIDERLLLKVVEDFHLPGHFEVKSVKNRAVVFDVAHTVNSMKNLVDNLRKSFKGKQFVFLVALMKDKDKKAILKIISGIAGNVFFTNAHKLRGESPEILADMAKKFGVKKVYTVGNPSTAYKNLLAKLKENEVLVVTGSHFLVGKTASLKN